MGTKVRCKSIFPGDYSMMNLNEENDSGRWPLYYEDKLFNSRQFFNTFSLQPARDLYLDNVKEVVKQMMLKHEAIFKNQVHELHCIYRMQRVLMEELKRQETHKYPISVEASFSNAPLSQKPSEDSKKICLIPSVSPVKSACSRASFSGIENMQSHLNFIEPNSTKADSFPTQNVGNLGDRALMEFKTRKLSRRTFDLQLPADEYIDSEEGDQTEEDNASQASVVGNNALKKNWGVSPENGIKLFLGSNANLDRQGLVSNSASHLGNKNSVADLNQPILVEEASSSASIDNFLGPVNCNGRIQRRDAVSLKQNSAFVGFPCEIFQNTRRADKDEESRHEWSSYELQSGPSGINMNSFSQDLGVDGFPSTSKIVKTEFKEALASPAFLLSGNNRTEITEPWTRNAVFGADVSERRQSVANHNLWGRVAATPMPCQYLVGPDVSNSVSLSASSMRRPTSSLSQNQDAFRGVDCFSLSAQSSKSSNVSIQGSKFNESKWHLNNHLRSDSSFGSKVSNRSGFLHGSPSELNALQARFPLVGFDSPNRSGENAPAVEHYENHHSTKYFEGSDREDVKSRKDINLNLALPNESHEGTIVQRDLQILNGAMKNEDSFGALPWFRTKPDTVQHSTSASRTCDAEDLRIETCDYSGTKKIFGVPILGNPHNSKELFFQNSTTKTFQSFSEKVAFQSSGMVKVLDILSREPTLCDSGRQLSLENVVVVKEQGEGLSGSRDQFDLNSCAGEEELLASSSIPKNTAKIAWEIDIEVPLLPETAEAILPGKYAENQYEMPTQSSVSQDRLQNQTGELVKAAAEALVFISSSFVPNHSKDDTQHPPGASVSDSLNWFAEVVSSYAGALANEEEVISRRKGVLELETLPYSSDESDYFERMTMKLTELKINEYLCKPSGAPDNLNNEETVVGFLMPTRRRRGQARRGRQRKDFQRDILPSIASLSRHEVTEDLQTIGGLMRATGQPWQTALERRNAARNGWARGRRRSRGPVSSVAAVAACVPPQQQLDDNNNNTSNNSNNELGLEERSLKGWGKTTRRPRCQRFVAGNPPPVPLTRV